MEQGRMFEHSNSPLLDWLVDRLSAHGGAMLTGGLGGFIGAMRSREKRWWVILQWIVVGGGIAPYVGSSLRHLGVEPAITDACVLIAGVFSFRLLDIVSTLIDRAGKLAERRLNRELK